MPRSFTALTFFCIAFALVEAVLVLYLRKVFSIEGGLIPTDYKVLLDLKAIAFLSFGSQVIPSSLITQLEIFRELATMVMLVAVAYLAGTNFRQRLGAYLIAFSLWDLFYYVFLKILTGWPKSLFDLDVFFLFPLPWIGPVITPIILFLILFIVGIRLFTQKMVRKMR